MDIPIGKVLYRYTVKNQKLYIHEGVVDNYGLRTCVNFRDSTPAVRCPRAEDIGVIRTVGHSLWLEKRDDKFAIRKFIAFEERKIAELEKQLSWKCGVVEMLNSELDKLEGYEV